MGHLTGPDPQGDRAEGPVGAGVTVPAHDRHAGLGQAPLRADDVDDPLVAGLRGQQRHAEVPAVPLDGGHHLLGQRVLQGAELTVGGDDVVDGGDRAVRVGDGQAALPEHGEGLRAGDLVDEVQADEQLGLPAVERADGVGVPDPVEQVRGEQVGGGGGVGHAAILQQGEELIPGEAGLIEDVVQRARTNVLALRHGEGRPRPGTPHPGVAAPCRDGARCGTRPSAGPA